MFFLIYNQVNKHTEDAFLEAFVPELHYLKAWLIKLTWVYDQLAPAHVITN